MTRSTRSPRSVRGMLMAVVAAAAMVLTMTTGVTPAGAAPAGSAPHARAAATETLRGAVMSGSSTLAHYKVSLYAARPDSAFTLLGSDTADKRGRFEIGYAPAPADAVLFVEAKLGRVLLASAIGTGEAAPEEVVINERTTVATGTAFAQFINDRKITGNRYGMANAVHMAANLVDPQTGELGAVLTTKPNGPETSTLATFNSLTNAVASCAAKQSSCTALFRGTAEPGGQMPKNVLQAVANIARYPSYPPDRKIRGLKSGDPVFLLSMLSPVNEPALTEPPTSWLLFLKFTGGPYSEQDADNLINGPGNFAIDEQGYVWVNDNAVPQVEHEFTCAGRRLLKFTPWGEPFPGTPYFGGGLSGAGYGITLDPSGKVWIGNFGFQDPPCALLPVAATSNSVSVFNPDGTPVSGDSGYTNGSISWPQGTVSDREGNIWIANCGNDSVTLLPGGDPDAARNIALGPVPRDGRPEMKPFGAAVGADGNVWIVNNRAGSVSVLSPDGELIDTISGTYKGKTVLSHPVGNASDSQGNMWVANSDWLDSPCPTRFRLGDAQNPSVTMIRADSRRPYPGSPFTGGGLTLPWGIAVDGDDTVWVFNFGAVPVGTSTDIPTGISRFCGIDRGGCPKGLKTGDPISPDTGYRSDALERITGGQIDPSGNIWLTNNWKRDANPVVNPFGNAIVVAVGAAAPLKTPLIGPPSGF
ncbi:MAG TPA: hypothetical protein VFN24_07135 [Microbacterium sp.]|nr:hypothetical protein [Microbacterium sp.]